MRINLNEIPNEGKSYQLNRRTSELNEVLSDLIGDMNYDVEIEIRPIENNKNFEFFGFIKTTLPEQCSRCGLDFKLPMHLKFKEILMPKMGQPRDSHYMKANHYSDLNNDGPSVTEYEGHHFELGEYLHEALALNEPFAPAPEEDKQGDCSVCKISLKGKTFGYEEHMEGQKESPFSVLKNVKIN